MLIFETYASPVPERNRIVASIEHLLLVSYSFYAQKAAGEYYQ
jgi:hypothetical protein